MDLKQLSRTLGLSPTTVSRALNGCSDVSETTRKRVIEAAQQAGYQPNVAARRLALGKADAVAILYPPGVGELGDPAFLAVVGGLTERFSELGSDLLLITTQLKDELSTYARMVRGRRVDALIVARTRVHDARVAFLIDSNFPFVAYGRTQRCDEHPWFDFDNTAGTQLAVQRLVGFGHRDIGYVHSPLELSFAAQRRAGFESALRSAGLACRPECVVGCGLGRRSGYEAMSRILALPKRPTAVIVDNNLGGIGAVRAMLDAGVVLGREMSVIVYDGVPEDNLLSAPKVTSVAQPTAQRAGAKLADMAMAAQRRAPLAELQVLWQPQLEAGATDGPAP